MDKIKKLIAINQRLSDALNFYAAYPNWAYKNIEEDKGRIALLALNGEYNKTRHNTYLSLDLEINQDCNKQPIGIIQVGVAWGSITDGILGTKSWYLKTSEKISPYITELTGITDEMITGMAVTHEIVAYELGELIKEKNTFVNPVTWGLGDAHELKNEFKARSIHFPFFGRRIIDVKHFYVFYQIASGRSVSGGLSSAMGKYGLQFNGKPHRADVDAENTLRLFFQLLRRQEKLEQCAKIIKDIK